MKNTSYVALGMLALMMLGIPACDWFKAKEANVREQPSTRILDVNTAEVYHDAHIPGAVHLDLDDIEKVSEFWNKQSPLILYCSDYSCRTSHIAAKKLQSLGFTDVSVYSGGINEWYKLSKENKQLYPIEGDMKLPFLEKNVEKVVLKEEDGKVISAQQVAEKLSEMHK